jgi:hypothetical protein
MSVTKAKTLELFALNGFGFPSEGTLVRTIQLSGIMLQLLGYRYARCHEPQSERVFSTKYLLGVPSSTDIGTPSIKKAS